MDQVVIDKFWERVEKGEKSYDCWTWIGQVNPNGALLLAVGDAVFNAKKVPLLLDKRPPTSKRIEYTCGNSRCVNPDHLVCGDVERFWAHVYKSSDGCWYWTGSTSGSTYSHQYGQIHIRSNGSNYIVSAHRFSWELHMKRSVPAGLWLCHTCDNPRCVNPSHLFLGTVQDNNKDRDEKGRQARGEKQGFAKLTEAQVREIRELHPSLSQMQLSKRYGVAKQVIQNILHRRSWKHVV